MANSTPSSNIRRRSASADDGLSRSIHPQTLHHNYKREDVNKSVWDCGSSLYDSFELYTFSQQLNHAMAGGSSSSRIIEDGKCRTLSMSHYVSHQSGGTLEFRNEPQQLNRAMAGKSSSPRIVEDGRSRSLSMPHFVSSRSGSTSQFQNGQPETIQEEVGDVLDYHFHSDFELQRPHPKSNNRLLRMGIPRMVQRFFTRAFFLKNKANKHRDRKDFEQERHNNIHAFQSHGQSEFNKLSVRSAIKV